MVGDLQAIAGTAMPEIPSLDAPLLENAVEPNGKLGDPSPTLFAQHPAIGLDRL
jgi:hypothetical protein